MMPGQSLGLCLEALSFTSKALRPATGGFSSARPLRKAWKVSVSQRLNSMELMQPSAGLTAPQDIMPDVLAQSRAGAHFAHRSPLPTRMRVSFNSAFVSKPQVDAFIFVPGLQLQTE